MSLCSSRDSLEISKAGGKHQTFTFRSHQGGQNKMQLQGFKHHNDISTLIFIQPSLRGLFVYTQKHGTGKTEMSQKGQSLYLLLTVVLLTPA